MTKPQVHHFDYSPCWLFPVMSVCGLRAARTVNRGGDDGKSAVSEGYLR